MSAPYIIPFNHQPVATGIQENSYTVPSGKYARVTIPICLVAYCVGDNLNAGPGTANLTSISTFSDSKNERFEIWLKAGDQITTETILASGNATYSFSWTGATSGNRTDNSVGTTYSNIRINSVLLAQYLAVAQASVSITFNEASSGSASGTYASFSGSGTAKIFYEEYNQIS